VKHKTAQNYAGRNAEEESGKGGGGNQNSTELPSFFVSTLVFRATRLRNVQAMNIQGLSEKTRQFQSRMITSVHRKYHCI
jgi:hypothetical protein